ncbi:M15 family metallopeptidase [Lutibacter holmesii]|uniref:M15 family metallopeptidase n=1 Tax=Lutibacter holmesii TaxID=1137985 RepID=A0ABW3WS00_9FLAO
MSKNCTFFYFFMLLFVCKNLYAQTNVSQLALTGKGDMALVGDEVELQPQVYKAFKAMQSAALKDGIAIQIISGYRSFERQQQIWNRKYAKYVSLGLEPQEAIKKIIEYSTIPGTSRHHWGTEIDIIDGNMKVEKSYLIEKNYSEGGAYLKLKKWMDLHSERFGFYIVYTNNPERKGFKYEPWHFSYKDLSDKLLEEFLRLDLQTELKNKSIHGSEYFSAEFLEKYLNENILDINPNLK